MTTKAVNLSSSTGLTLDPRPTLWQVAASQLMQALARGLDFSASRYEPRTADDLLLLADQYEATQPSYAADLREAAYRHLAASQPGESALERAERPVTARNPFRWTSYGRLACGPSALGAAHAWRPLTS
jgi:hypothetical protein